MDLNSKKVSGKVSCAFNSKSKLMPSDAEHVISPTWVLISTIKTVLLDMTIQMCPAAFQIQASRTRGWLL